MMEPNRSLLSVDTAFTLLSSPPSRFATWTNFTGPISGCDSSDPSMLLSCCRYWDEHWNGVLWHST